MPGWTKSYVVVYRQLTYDMEISPEIMEKALATCAELKREVTDQVKSLAKHPQIVPITAGAAISAILLWRMTTRDDNSVTASKSEKITPVQSAAAAGEQTIIEEEYGEDFIEEGDEIDQKWARHTEEFCRKQR